MEDADKKITSLWDGEIQSQKGNTYIIKYPVWNQTIPAGGKAVIGFNGTCSGSVKSPYNCTILNKKEETSPEEYTISYKTTSDWKDAFNAQIDITNHTNQNVENWNLEFDFDSDIHSFWTAKMVKKEGNHYVIKHDTWNSILKPGQTISLGFEAKPGNPTSPPRNFKLIKDAPVDSEDTEKEDWTIDSDGDLFVDLLEKQFGTDKNKKDTDMDGFDDYYEIIFLGTDPTKEDSDGNGISDREEDADDDGISNFEEVKLGLDARYSDSDLDNLEDGDETLKYKTNPLESDSDGDGILDGDEVKLGLNPLSPATLPNVQDNCYIMTQEVSAEVLERINLESPYTLSVSVKGAGCADTVLGVYESDYRELWKNNGSIIGKTVALQYPEFIMEEITLKFKMEDKLVKKSNVNFPDSEGLQGLKRYQIFHYDELSGILYPVNTIFDETQNTLSVTMEEAGDYCIIDMDKWLYLTGLDLGQEKAVTENSNFPISVASRKENNEVSKNSTSEKDRKVEKDILPSNYDSIVKKQIAEIGTRSNKKGRAATTNSQNSTNKPADLVFVIDTSTSMNDRIANCKKDLSNLFHNLYANGISARVSIITFIGKNKPITIHQLDTSEIWGTNPKDAEKLVKTVTVSGGDYENHMDALDAAISLSYRDNAVKFAFLLTDEPMKEKDNHIRMTTAKFAAKLKSKGIITSVLCTEKTKESFRPIFEKTNGIQVSIDSAYLTYVELFIQTVLKDSLFYYVRLPNTLETIRLSAVPSKGSSIDTDKDSLTDSKEINWSMIESSKNKLILPTLREYWKAMSTRNPDYFGRMSERERKLLDTIVVLPILSNPASKDSDGDLYHDKIDPRSMKNDVHVVELTKKDYVPVRYTLDKENPNLVSYGGNQSWKYVDKGSTPIIDNYGCGLIAVVDHLIYLSRVKKSCNTPTTNLLKWNADRTIQCNSYRGFVLYINQTMVPVYNVLGAPPLSFQMN